MTTFMTYKEECEALRQRVAELERGLDSAYQLADHYRDERDALKKLYESSEEYVIALKETRNRLAEERDEWRSKHDVACLTITNLQSKYECQLSATSKTMQGVVELTAERDALKQQRDELLAALGSGGRHCNDDTPHSNLCEAIIDSKEADLGQGLDPFWKWAFRRGFHEAETSYKVDIATLEQQRDVLLAALESNQSRGVRDVIVERRRQINIEGWSSHHDDQHSYGEMALAAGCYAMFGLCFHEGDPPKYWPWDKKWWKPSDKRRNLVKAAALIIAEIERIDRATIASVKGGA